MLKLYKSSDEARIYQMDGMDSPERWVVTTPETRLICNDPGVAGIRYTDLLRKACASILKIADLNLKEDATAVINILRGGLNFGLRDALSDAFGWNSHTTCFISAQRARTHADSEEWHITENAYRKVYFPKEVSLVIGDVVATGTSLRYALTELIRSAKTAGSAIRNIIFFTIGGVKAGEIIHEIDEQCRAVFPDYQRTVLIYLEGCFQVPDRQTPLTIRLTGTDLVRLGSVVAPEFEESQYENPSFPLERCTIYDAGSRAFWVREYAADVTSYWRQVLELANRGVTFAEYLAERCPAISPERFGTVSLHDLAVRQIKKMSSFIH